MKESLDRQKATIAERYANEREIGRGGMALIFRAPVPVDDVVLLRQLQVFGAGARQRSDLATTPKPVAPLPL